MIEQPSPIKRLYALVNPRFELHTGIARSVKGFGYVTIARHTKSGTTLLVSQGDDVTAHRTFIKPLATHIALDNTPVKLTATALQGQDADAWIDQHEDKIIPVGMSADQVRNEWEVDNDTIYAATVADSRLDAFNRQFNHNSFLFTSVNVPLRDLATLYAEYVNEPFILWSVLHDHSILGYVHSGTLRNLLHFWAGHDDISNDPVAAAAHCLPMLRSLCRQERAGTIIINKPVLLDKVAPHLEGYALKPPPEIRGFRPERHEALALALHRKSTLDFATFEQAQQTATLLDSRKSALFTAISLAGVLAGCALLILLSSVGISIYQQHTDARVAPVRSQIEEVNAQQARLDSLQAQFQEFMAVASRESKVTALLSELQTALPDGVWTDRVEIMESDPTSWNITISALATSSSMISTVIRNLNAIPDVSDAKMLYSELSKTDRGKRVMKFRITGDI
ncbi:MAG: hypothetical protein GF398_18325 [Chitinivibrionales bacterium]|nr:hypothetical protein [Chitinivibrionales bacterium]